MITIAQDMLKIEDNLQQEMAQHAKSEKLKTIMNILNLKIINKQ